MNKGKKKEESRENNEVNLEKAELEERKMMI